MYPKRRFFILFTQYRQIYFALSALTVLCLGLVSVTAQAMSVKPVSFKSIVESSGTIVHGIATKVSSGTDPQTGMICTWTTIRVFDGLKGKTDSKEVTFKQIGGVDKKTGVRWGVSEILAEPGEEVLICLHPESRLGLTSPVGYKQGVFRVKKEKSTGGKYVDNGMSKAVLFPDEDVKSTAKSKSGRSAGELEAVERCSSLKLDDVKEGIAGLVSIQEGKELSPIQKMKRNFRSR